jgi:hypothetical protein
VVAAAGAALVSVFIWMNAPFTGVFGATRAFDVGTGDATRYLLPGTAVATLAVALASRRGGWLRAAGVVLFAAALLVDVQQTFALGYPNVPSPGTPLVGMALGAAAVAGLAWLGPRLRVRVPAALAGASAAVALAALGAVAATGYVARHGDTGTRESPLAAWFARQPDWRRGAAAVASTWSLVGTLSGDRLQHPLVLVGAREACRRGAAAGWLVVDRNEARAEGARPCAAPAGFTDPDFQAYGPMQLRGTAASTLRGP